MKENILLSLPPERMGNWTYLSTPNTVRSKHSLDYVTSGGKGYLLLLGGLASNNSYITNHFSSYDISTNTWTSRTYGYGNIAYHSTASFGSKMWVYGGTDGVVAGGLNTLRTYDYNTHTWNTLASGPGNRWTSSLCYLDNYLYVYGGLTSGGVRFKDFHCYSIADNNWTKLADGPGERNNPTLIGYNGKVYMFSGFSTTISNYMSDLWEYDVNTDQWTELDTLPFTVIAPKLRAYDNSLFIFGSMYEAQNVMIRYSLTTKKIMFLNPGFSDRIYFGFTNNENIFYAQGGIKDTTSYNNLGIFTY